MPRIWLSTSGNIGLSKYVGGCFLTLIYMVLVVIGLLGIVALAYSLT